MMAKNKGKKDSTKKDKAKKAAPEVTKVQPGEVVTKGGRQISSTGPMTIVKGTGKGKGKTTVEVTRGDLYVSGRQINRGGTR